MAFNSFREASKRGNWGTTLASESIEQVNCGSFQRMADAMEIITRRYQDLIDERDRFKRWHNEERGKVARLEKVAAGLRGQITKLKKKTGEQ